MSEAPALAWLDDVQAMVAAEDPDGRLVPCELADLVIGPGVLASVVDAVAGLVPAGCKNPASVVLLVDATPVYREGADVKAMVEQDLANRFDARRVVLGFTEFDQGQCVIEIAFEFFEIGHCALKRLALAHYFLCGPGIVPKTGILRFGVQARKTFLCRVPVKATSSGGRVPP